MGDRARRQLRSFSFFYRWLFCLGIFSIPTPPPHIKFPYGTRAQTRRRGSRESQDCRDARHVRRQAATPRPPADRPRCRGHRRQWCLGGNPLSRRKYRSDARRCGRVLALRRKSRQGLLWTDDLTLIGAVGHRAKQKGRQKKKDAALLVAILFFLFDYSSAFFYGHAPRLPARPHMIPVYQTTTAVAKRRRETGCRHWRRHVFFSSFFCDRLYKR